MTIHYVAFLSQVQCTIAVRVSLQVSSEAISVSVIAVPMLADQNATDLIVQLYQATLPKLRATDLDQVTTVSQNIRESLLLLVCLSRYVLGECPRCFFRRCTCYRPVQEVKEKAISSAGLFAARCGDQLSAEQVFFIHYLLSYITMKHPVIRHLTLSCS